LVLRKTRIVLNQNSEHRLTSGHSFREADALLAKKRRGIRLFTHFIICVGFHPNGEPKFIGNLMGVGVGEIPKQKLLELLEEYEVTAIRKFEGTHYDRQRAVQRAYSEIGKSYSLMGNNCERFANYVQYGERKSPQVTKFGALGVLGLFLITGLAKAGKR
jgi:hypothetical protein